MVDRNLRGDIPLFLLCSFNEYAVGVFDEVACCWRKWLDMGSVDNFALMLIVGYQ
jgi:hypothetical protein